MIDAKIRYRISPKGVTFWYQLDRPDVSVRLAIDEVYQRVCDLAGAIAGRGVKVYMGSGENY